MATVGGSQSPAETDSGPGGGEGSGTWGQGEAKLAPGAAAACWGRQCSVEPGDPAPRPGRPGSRQVRCSSSPAGRGREEQRCLGPGGRLGYARGCSSAPVPHPGGLAQLPESLGFPPRSGIPDHRGLVPSHAPWGCPLLTLRVHPHPHQQAQIRLHHGAPEAERASHPPLSQPCPLAGQC